MSWSQSEARQRYLDGGLSAVYPDVYAADGIAGASEKADRWRPLSSTVKAWLKSGLITKAQAKNALPNAVKADRTRRRPARHASLNA